MLIHLYISLLYLIIENSKIVLNITQIMASIIAYVKVCLLLYYPVVNNALREMPIRNMYHDAYLVGMVVLNLNFSAKSTIESMVPM